MVGYIFYKMSQNKTVTCQLKCSQFLKQVNASFFEVKGFSRKIKVSTQPQPDATVILQDSSVAVVFISDCLFC